MIRPSYSARPTITPAQPMAWTASTSSTEATPPDAMIRPRPRPRGRATARGPVPRAGRRARSTSPRTSTMPALASMSIASTAGMPGAPWRHPSPSARPSRMSIEAAMRSGPWRPTIDATKAGSWSAAVPTVTRAAPVPIAPATDTAVRSPPPSSTRPGRTSPRRSPRPSRAAAARRRWPRRGRRRAASRPLRAKRPPPRPGRPVGRLRARSRPARGGRRDPRGGRSPGAARRRPES